MRSLFVLALTLTACGSPEPRGSTVVDNPLLGSWQTEDPPALRFVLEQTFGDDESDLRALLTSVSSMTADRDGNIYVMDGFNSRRLVAFSSDGSVLWETGRPGQAPGEFENPGALVFDGESRLSGGRIDWFDLQGEFVESENTADLGLGQISLTGFLDPHTMVVRRALPGMFGALTSVLSLQGDWVVTDTFSTDLSEGMELPDIMSVWTRMGVAQGLITIPHLTHYRYSWYDRNGNLQRQVTRGRLLIEPPDAREITGGYSVRNWSTMYLPIELSEGRWLAGGRWPLDLGDPEEYTREAEAGNRRQLTMMHAIDLYDRAGRLLYAMSSDEVEALGIQRLLASDSRGHVYAQLKSAPVIGRFRVDISPPDA